MRSTVWLVGAAVVLAGIGATAAPATAEAGLPLTKPGMAWASLRVADVPKSIGKNLTRSISYNAVPKTLRFEMCVDKDGHKVFGTKPLQHLNSSIPLSQTGSGNNITASVAVSSDIYGYASVRAANVRWNQLVRATSRCAKVIHKPISFKGAAVLANVRQQKQVLPSACSSPGFAIAQQVAVNVASGAPNGLNIYVGGYSAYRKVGTTILRVQFANYTETSAAASKIRPGWSAFTRTEAVRISRRVAQLPIR